MLIRHDVVLDVAVHRCGNLGYSCLQFAKKLHQPLAVIALGKPFTVRDSTPVKLGIWVEEPVGCDQFDAGVFRPAMKQCLQNTGRGAFAHGNAARDANHIWHLWCNRSQERGRHTMKVLCRADIQVE